MKNIPIILICFFLCSCNLFLEKESFANAGDDVTSFVGSYGVLDHSKSIVNDNIANIYWEQADNNPYEYVLAENINLSVKQYIGFFEEGIYEFVLNIQCTDGNIYKDTVKFKVEARQNSVMEDIGLEILARIDIDYPTGDLTEAMLDKVDSLWSAELYLSEKISNTDGIQYCTNIEFLSLSYQDISDLTNFQYLTKVKTLYLNNNTITDISPLVNMVNLEELVIYDNDIGDISPISNMLKLEKLYIMYNPILGVDAIQNLLDLKIVFISGAGENASFSNIEPLEKLINIEKLHIFGEEISDISVLKNLNNMYLLNMSSNNISDLDPLKNLLKLDRLKMIDNKLTSLNGLENLKLTYIDVSMNQITDISALGEMTELNEIYLSYNEISNIEVLFNNNNIDSGDIIFLSDNPLDSISVNYYIPSLRNRDVLVYY